MTKVTHNGKQYTIGGLYEFSDDGDDWCSGLLTSIEVVDADYPFQENNLTNWKYIREIQNPIIGTIEDALVELEDGCAYTFNLDDEICFGIYDDDQGLMMTNKLNVFVSDCTNIVKLVPEVK